MVGFVTVGAVWPLTGVDLTVCRVVGCEGATGFLFVEIVLDLAVLVVLTGSLLLPDMTEGLVSSGLYVFTSTSAGVPELVPLWG